VAIADGKVMLGVVDPGVGSWNQIATWLSGVDAVRVEGAGKSL